MLHTLGPRAAPEDFVGLLLECHRRIRHFVELAQEVGRRTELPEAEVVEACARCERYFTEALPLHVEDEEKSVLPRLKGARLEAEAEQGTEEAPDDVAEREPAGLELSDALDAMHAQHLEHEPLLRALLESLRSVRGEPRDQARRARLSAAAAQLGLEFEKHLALEEEVLFPAIRSRLSDEAQQQALLELRARRRPPGNASAH